MTLEDEDSIREISNRIGSFMNCSGSFVYDEITKIIKAGESESLRYIELDTINNQYYKMACEYMAKTELYDRSLTNCRSPWDKTEAFLDNPRVKRLSNAYAAQLRKYYSEICGGTWQYIHEEIHKHTNYTAQMWIEEYKRLNRKYR